MTPWFTVLTAITLNVNGLGDKVVRFMADYTKSRCVMFSGDLSAHCT